MAEQESGFIAEHYSKALARLERGVQEAKRTIAETSSLYQDAGMITLRGCLVEFQTSLALKVEGSVARTADFHQIHGRYGSETKLEIGKIDPTSLQNFGFEYFPAISLFEKDGTFIQVQHLDVLLIPWNSFLIHSNPHSLMVVYTDRGVEFQLTSGQKIMNDRKPLERGIAVAELLKWVDGEIDRKIKTPLTK